MSEELHDSLGAALSRELADHCESTGAVEKAGAAFERGDAPRFRTRTSSSSVLTALTGFFRTKSASRDALQRPRRGRPLVVGAAFVFAVTTAIVLLVLGLRARQTTLPIAFEIRADEANGQRGEIGHFMVAPKASPLPLSFSDGTQLMLMPEASARVAEVNPRGARVVLESGALQASVVHHEDTKWTIDAGPYSVLVTGTRFVVAWEPTAQALDVTLEEGSVVITGCEPNKAQRVAAGERVHLVCAREMNSPRLTLGPPPSVPVAVPQRTLPLNQDAARLAIGADAGAPPPAATTSAAAPPSSASSAASANVPPNATLDQLLASADEARFSGHQDVAIEQLEAIRKRAPGSEQAATAAFQLGMIYYDGAHNYGRAADSFDAYLREKPAGRLVREALARAAEAHERNGEHETARKIATTYLTRFPQGPQAAIAWRIADGTYGEKAP